MTDFDLKLTELVYQWRTVPELSSIFGMHPQVIRQHLKRLGLTASNHRSPYQPYGLTENTFRLRSCLAERIISLREKGLKPREISEITGLNRDELCRAERRPYSHDWTLSQMERTEKYFGRTVNGIV